MKKMLPPMIFLKKLVATYHIQKFSHWAFNVIFSTKMKSGAGGCETLPTPCESFQLQAKSYAIEHIQTAMTITEHNAVPVSIVLNPVFGVALVCKKGDNVHDILFAQQDDFVGLVSHGEPPCGWWVENSLFLSTHILYTVFSKLQAGPGGFCGFFSSCPH